MSRRTAIGFLYSSEWSHEFEAHAAGHVPSHRLFGAAGVQSLGTCVRTARWWVRVPKACRTPAIWKAWQALWCLSVQRSLMAAVCTTEAPGPPLLLLKRLGLLRIRVVVISVALTRHRDGARRTVWSWLLRGADAILVYTPDQVADLIDTFGCDASRVHFEPLGIDCNFFRPLDAEKIAEPVEHWDVLSVGTNEGKDFLTLMEALWPSSKCLVVTDDWNAGLVRSSPHRRDVTIRQHVPIRELRVLYGTARVVALPLRERNQSSGQTVLLENLAMGNNVVVSDVTSVRCYVNPDVVHLVPTGDAAALRSALTLPPAADSSRIRTWVAEHFSAERFAEALLAHCRDKPPEDRQRT